MNTNLSNDSLAGSGQGDVRIVKVKKGQSELRLAVQPSLRETAELLAREFTVQGTKEDDVELAPIELHAAFLNFVAHYETEDRTLAVIPLLKTVYEQFCARHLGTDGIHARTATMDEATRVELIRNTGHAFHKLVLAGATETSECLHVAPKSALFEAAKTGKASIASVFGGQGANGVLGELSQLYSTYPEVQDFVQKMCAVIKACGETPEALQTGLHHQGLDIMLWLEQPSTQPDEDYLIEAPVSFPLIGLAQLANYWLMLQVLHMDPSEVLKLTKYTTGHSQGIVCAAAVASANSVQSFYASSIKALKLLFWMGLRVQQACPLTTLNPSILADSLAHDEGIPTPMLVVSRLPQSVVQERVDAANKLLPEGRQMEITLVNGPRTVVVSGHPQALYGLQVTLRDLKAGKESQARVAPSKRKQNFATKYLPVSAPFHSHYLKSVPAALEADIVREDLTWVSKPEVEVRSTDDGSDLRNAKDLTRELVRLICVCHVNWPAATAEKVTHMLDFGPGRQAGVGILLHRNKQGSGVRVVLVGSETTTDSELPSKALVFSGNQEALSFAPDWAQEYAPKLVKLRGTGKVHISTPFSQLLGKPPVMVAGMTPTSANAQFISAVTNAGYHCELAGGGHHNPAMMTNCIEKIMDQTPPGSNVTCNLLFLNPFLWGFQYPLVKKLRQQGYPTDGLVIAAGVPAGDNANEILSTLKEAGVRHISFKPGSVDSIRDVINVADANPYMPIIMQWTGGRGGGHHSFEDFHQPILETYHHIRKRKNIILVAGSGLGDAASALPLMTGEWSVKFDYPPMPFDAVLLGSRMLVAKEAFTAESVKKHLAENCEGVPMEREAEWEKTYTGILGGITTVNSEMGEPIHKVATRGMMLWKDMDEKIFKLPIKDQLPALLKMKDSVIKRLNSDFQKPYFARKADGTVCDVDQMTYAEVVRRMVSLTWIAHKKRWIDPTLRRSTYEVFVRAAERLGNGKLPKLLEAEDLLEKHPEGVMAAVDEALAELPGAEIQLMSSQDIQYFLAVCSRRDRKPPNFIPILDDNFKAYFKKDSLFYSEDLDSVPEQDLQRVCILQGPVAVHHSRKANEPVAEILGNMYNGLIQALQERNAPTEEVESLNEKHEAAAPVPSGVEMQVDGSTTVYTMPKVASRLPEADAWLAHLAGSKYNWLQVLLTVPMIVQGRTWTTNNSMRRLFKPKPAQVIRVERDASGTPTSVKVYDPALSEAMTENGAPAPALVASVSGTQITLTLNEPSLVRKGAAEPLTLRYEYKPEMGYAPIHEVMEGRNAAINDFYSRIWFGEPLAKAFGADTTVAARPIKSTHTIKRAEITAFCRATENKSEASVERGQDVLEAPMDFAIVAGWRAIMGALLASHVNGDMLRLVHLSNSFKILNSAAPLREGDVCETEAEVVKVRTAPGTNNLVVGVRGTIRRNSVDIMQLASEFLYRAGPKESWDPSMFFEKKTETPVELKMNRLQDIAVLKSKPWAQWATDAEQYLREGATLVFRLDSLTKPKANNDIAYVKTTGTIVAQFDTEEKHEIGSVVYEKTDVKGNAVLGYLQRHGKLLEEEELFGSGGYSLMPKSDAFSSTIMTPATNKTYAAASGDTNPIHVNSYFADYVELPGTITHGMWTSASTRRLVEVFAASNNPQRVVSYHVEFAGMVLPGDKLETKLKHVGMAEGKMIVNVDTFNQHGTKVLHGVAHVQQPTTAYVFTGQGSQEKGMGMDLYATSPVAKAIWDRADKHFRERYGFSIIDIVQNNPKERTVYFGGQKGAAMREFYMNLSYDVVDSQGKVETLSLFPTINKETQFFTFRHPEGLLAATQFTQPSLVLFEKAAFEDMRARGLIQKGATFAGHSLGEYAAISSFSNMLTVESLMDVVFYRGMTMQYAVKRHPDGTSDFGMVALNPARVGLNEKLMLMLCDMITACNPGSLLQIVNYNVENWQYVAAGEVSSLETLTQVLNVAKQKAVDFRKVQPADVEAVIKTCLQGVLEAKAQKGRIQLTRGVATIPLPGIDVPFHSRFLLSGVGPFRSYLRSRLDKDIDLSLLEGQYIPNLTARPFIVNKQYFDEVYETTHSKELEAIAKEIDLSKPLTLKDKQRLGFTILVELLAYQFASPVQWIKTQDVFFGERNIERLVEFGPSGTLSGMAQRTLTLKFSSEDKLRSQTRTVLTISKDKQALYFDFTSDDDEPAASDDSAPAAAPAAATAPAPVMAAAPMPVAGAGGPAVDRPVTTKEVVRTVVALKLKKALGEVPMDKSVKDLVGGKSTMQNEILGDLSAELATSTMPERVEEMPLAEVADKLTGSGRLGKLLAGKVAKLVGTKMPAGFNNKKVADHLQQRFNIVGASVDGVMMTALTMEPAARIGDEAKAKEFLDTAAQAYAAAAGISLSSGGAAAAPAMAMSMMQMAAGPSGPAAVADKPVSAIEFLRVLIALRVKKSVADVPATATIKSLVGGKSTLQNELLGDIQAEFGDGFKAPSDPAELPLDALANAVTSYAHPGKVTRGLAGRLAASKLPAGFSMTAAKAHLGAKHGLGAERQNGAILHGLAMEPAARLASKAEAEAWLDTVAASYAAANGVTLGAGGAGGATMGGFMAASVDLASSGQYQADQAKQRRMLEDNVKSMQAYLGIDPRAGDKLAEEQARLAAALEADKAQFLAEHGEFYVDGTKGRFSAKMARKYDSNWNWARQDFMELVLEASTLPEPIAADKLKELRAKWEFILNRVTPSLLEMFDYYFGKTNHGKKTAELLGINVASIKDTKAPRYVSKVENKAPHVEISEDGKLKYSETVRPQSYIDEITASPVSAETQAEAERLADMLQAATLRPETRAMFMAMLKQLPETSGELPPLHIREQKVGKWHYNENMTKMYLEALAAISSEGLCLKDKTVLMTGCGKGSIGEAILEAVLAAGANVVVTTSSFNYSTTEFFRAKYETNGGRSSALTILPFNQGSVADVNALVDYVYDTMQIDLDVVIPFAAISEGGREIDNIDSRSELAHRMMLTNVLRLAGSIKAKKAARGFDTRPSYMVLPLSPNHGVFGGDGLYAESKIGLEVLFNKWHSESWNKYISLAGAVIGWTRGTGLMAQNNIVAEGVEKLGVRTFSQAEMSLNIIGLLHQSMVDLASTTPVWADLTGGMDKVEGLDKALNQLRADLNLKASTREAVAKDTQADAQVEKGARTPPRESEKRANLLVEFPKVSPYEDLSARVGHLKGMVDLAKVVVVTGFGEVGPWGSSRTRWAMEKDGKFSLEGCVEIAWMMGLIRHHNGMIGKEFYCGWVDAASGQPVKDLDIKAKYEERILAHTGIRVIEPELFDGYDPNKKKFLVQVAIERDIGPVECTEEEAMHYKREHGEHAEIYKNESGQWLAFFKKGAQIYIPKALKFDRLVAGQIPTGWDARRYGVPEDICRQVDPVTLYNLVSTVEALVSSGITDPYEFYEYVHVSEVGNTSGGGVGGMRSNIEMYKDRFLDKPVAGDKLQETFINTMPAWVNLLLLSSSGPIKSPVGACATAVQSVEIGVETILSGKAKIVIAGGYDDFQEPGSYEFAQMRATSNTEDEYAAGRTPREMSRPATTTRAGFMEAMGAGNHILMSAELAIKIGVPVYGIVALTNTATDKEGRSIPAPGQGILTTAREHHGQRLPQLMDLKYRKRQLDFASKHIKLWMETEISLLRDEVETGLPEGEFALRVAEIEKEAERQRKAAIATWGNEFYKNNTEISPLRGALAVFGLTADDIGVASFHGTSTKANDKNESSVLHAQLAHIGRTPGNPVPGVFQKYLTGHPKGAACAWMLNGVLQCMQDGVVPGNRNADNIDEVMAQFTNVLYPSHTLKVGHIKAGLIKSFGFGQVGGEALVIHPDYVLGLLEKADLEAYLAKRQVREAASYRYFHDAISNTKPYVRVKTSPPYTVDQERTVYLNPEARAHFDKASGSWKYSNQGAAGRVSHPGKDRMAQALEATLEKTAGGAARGFGVDVEQVAAVNVSNPTFLERNFTQAEIDYCNAAADPQASFAGRWSAKEAVIKAISNLHPDTPAGWLGAGAGLKNIEVLPSESKAPVVVLHGAAADVAKKAGAKEVKVSISHSGEYAVATAIAQ